MKTAYKVMGIISIALGGMAMLQGIGAIEGYSIIGGALFLTNGIFLVIASKK